MREPPPVTPARIALVGPSAPWRGGIAQHVDAFSRALSARGHDTRIVSFSRQYPAWLFPGKDQRDPSRRARDEATFELDTLNPFSWHAAGRRAARWTPDVVVVSYWLPFFVPVFAGFLRPLDRRRTRVVFDCHNVRPHERRWMDERLTAWMLGLADDFIVHSEAVADTLTSLRPDARVLTAPLPEADGFPDGPGRSDARGRLGLPPGATVLLFFGFVRRYKGLDVVLDAMSHLPDSVHLLVAGEFYEPRERYAPALDALASRVHVHADFIPTEDVGTYFDAADLVVLPYHRATQSGVFPLAMRFGVPVVATRVGGMAEVVTEGVTGTFAEAATGPAFATAVTRAIGSAAALARGVAERDAAKGTWPALVRAFEAAYLDAPDAPG